MQVGNWSGENVLLDEKTLQTLGPGEFLNRVYEDAPRRTYSSLFIAYFPSQRMGDTIHSPKNCIPGAGWTPIESAAISLPVMNGQSIDVNRYVIARGLDRQLVLYWYQSHGRVTPSEYWAKIHLVTDSVRLNRSDGALVRVITPIAERESMASAQNRAVQFSQQIFPLVSTYIPR